MITEYRNDKAEKAPGYWYTYTYDNGLRVTFAEYQGDLDELEELGRNLSRKKRREIRMRIHDGCTDRIHAIFRYTDCNHRCFIELITKNILRINMIRKIGEKRI